MVATHKLESVVQRASSANDQPSEACSFNYQVSALDANNPGKYSGTYSPEWKSTCNGAVADLATTVDVQAGDGTKFPVGSKIKVGTSTGHNVNSVATDTLTVAPGISGAQADGAVICPDTTDPGFWDKCMSEAKTAETAAHSAILFS